MARRRADLIGAARPEYEARAAFLVRPGCEARPAFVARRTRAGQINRS
ncbi:hypothetical protein AB0F95_03075 [Micromonospora tulbaghiae]